MKHAKNKYSYWTSRLRNYGFSSGLGQPDWSNRLVWFAYENILIIDNIYYGIERKWRNCSSTPYGYSNIYVSPFFTHRIFWNFGSHCTLGSTLIGYLPDTFSGEKHFLQGRVLDNQQKFCWRMNEFTLWTEGYVHLIMWLLKF